MDVDQAAAYEQREASTGVRVAALAIFGKSNQPIPAPDPPRHRGWTVFGVEPDRRSATYEEKVVNHEAELHGDKGEQGRGILRTGIAVANSDSHCLGRVDDFEIRCIDLNFSD